MVKKIVKSYPGVKTVHLVMDNLNMHKEKHLIEYYGKLIGAKICSKITPHYTPKHASWLNQAEIEIGMFNRGCIGKKRVLDLEELKIRSKAWSKYMNRKKVKIDWTFSRRKARKKFSYRPGKN